eukprot:TRINITY_DN3529_c0_g1_i3.p1 TRINITY_DN3529_c0_g1~~TRINITY_DN3529_c0_g1_i3.p1  ORF type:complete len:448 (+),score=93.32 TRINITY_DN3529_c0_g1_i3:98-1441(+)
MRVLTAFVLLLGNSYSLEVRQQRSEPPTLLAEDGPQDEIEKATEEIRSRLEAKGIVLPDSLQQQAPNPLAMAPPPPILPSVSLASFSAGAPAGEEPAAPSPSAAPGPAPAVGAVAGEMQLVTEETCAKAAKATDALSCSLITQISGKPDGCECRYMGSACPEADKSLGFTGMSPSHVIPVPQTGDSVILCMYWQWFEYKDRSAETESRRDETKKMALDYLRQGFQTVVDAVQPQAEFYATVTTTPIPLIDRGKVEQAVLHALHDFNASVYTPVYDGRVESNKYPTYAKPGEPVEWSGGNYKDALSEQLGREVKDGDYLAAGPGLNVMTYKDLEDRVKENRDKLFPIRVSPAEVPKNDPKWGDPVEWLGGNYREALEKQLGREMKDEDLMIAPNGAKMTYKELEAEVKADREKLFPVGVSPAENDDGAYLTPVTEAPPTPPPPTTPTP